MVGCSQRIIKCVSIVCWVVLLCSCKTGDFFGQLLVFQNTKNENNHLYSNSNASYPCGNFSDTSCLKPLKSKGSIGHAFTVCIRTEKNQVSFCPFAPREVSVLAELTLGHLRYPLTDVPPHQSNSPPDTVSGAHRRPWAERAPGGFTPEPFLWVTKIPAPHRISKETIKVVNYKARSLARRRFSGFPDPLWQGANTCCSLHCSDMRPRTSKGITELLFLNLVCVPRTCPSKKSNCAQQAGRADYLAG